MLISHVPLEVVIKNQCTTLFWHRDKCSLFWHLQDGPEPPISAPAAAEAPAELQPDPEIVAALTSMGFSENGSKRAAVATQV